MPVEDVTDTLSAQLTSSIAPSTVNANNANASSLLSGLLGDKYVHGVVSCRTMPNINPISLARTFKLGLA